LLRKPRNWNNSFFFKKKKKVKSLLLPRVAVRTSGEYIHRYRMKKKILTDWRAGKNTWST